LSNCALAIYRQGSDKCIKKAGNAEEASKVLEKVFIPASATFIKK
jgi:hypothetical protein